MIKQSIKLLLICQVSKKNILLKYFSDKKYIQATRGVKNYFFYILLFEIFYLVTVFSIRINIIPKIIPLFHKTNKIFLLKYHVDNIIYYILLIDISSTVYSHFLNIN